MRVARFRRDLLDWYARVKRDLPWRKTRDPYAIWLSEVMLQQTRVAAALPYYKKFLERFPSVVDLASAVEADVLTHWAGLGYYSRARNLHKTAQEVAARGGQFPGSRTELLALPGIGAYTAAAIGSMAFELPLAAVDGNLLRVIARLDNDPSDIGNPRTRVRFTTRAQELLDVGRPGDFNQAMMELGATICLPKSPRCPECPVSAQCAARIAGRQSELPVKVRKQNKISLDRLVLVIVNRCDILLRQRPSDAGQMPGFWELPEAGQLPEATVGEEIGEVRHTITHHYYRYQVHRAQWSGNAMKPFAWKDLRRIDEVLITTAAKKALQCLSPE